MHGPVTVVFERPINLAKVIIKMCQVARDETCIEINFNKIKIS